MGSDVDEKEDTEATMMYYGTTFIQEADFPLNFNLINMKNLSGNSVFEAVSLWMKNMPAGKWPNWAVREQLLQQGLAPLGDSFSYGPPLLKSSVVAAAATQPRGWALRDIHVKLSTAVVAVFGAGQTGGGSALE